MLRGYGAFYTVLKTVRDAIVVELQKQQAKPERVSIVPGAIAWDECDQCGLLALTSSRFYLTDTFPIDVVTTEMKQGAFLAADLMVQIIRCAPTAQDTNSAPSVEALDNSAQQVLDDAFAVLCTTHTTLHTLLDTNQIVDYMMRQQLFVGPAGACVGSETIFTVAINR